tara:strand:- start:3603 stop:3773 length:171 start_codon:yes stop_codon:yes gene_type:complete
MIDKRELDYLEKEYIGLCVKDFNSINESVRRTARLDEIEASVGQDITMSWYKKAEL